VCWIPGDLVVTPLQVRPPSLEWNAPTAVVIALAIGTTTMPSGRTTGWPPITPAWLVAGALQVWPPSVERLIWSRLRTLWSSHWV